jgi:tetratricopeptide (TPR) repeat protein
LQAAGILCSRGLHKSAVILYIDERVIIQVIRRLNAKCRLTIASAITLCTLLHGGCVTPGYAASNLFEPGSYEQLARAEQVFFGKPNTTNSYFRRLDLLDVGIFGRVRSGSAEKRFDRISDALGLDTMNYATSRPPGDLTKGLANHESRENAANAQTESNLSDRKHGDTGSDLTSTYSVDSSPSSSSASSNPGENISSTSTSKPAEKNHEQKDSSIVASKSDSSFKSDSPSKPDTAAKAAFSSAFNSAFNPANKNTATASKSTATAIKEKPVAAAKPALSPILSKETPKLEPQVARVAQKATDGADHRIKRPVPGASTDIARDKTKEVEELFKRGMSEFRVKHYAEAQICFKKILAIDPRNVDAYYNLGSLSETKHDYVDALTYYRAALATKPADSDFKSAVHAMEVELHKQHAMTASASEHRSTNSTVASGAKSVGSSTSHIADVGSPRAPIADVGSSRAPEVTVGGQKAPIVDISSTDAPVLPVQQLDDKTFSLQTAQNGVTTPFTPMNGVSAPYQGVPIYGVPPTLAGNIPSNNNISQSPPSSNTRGTFNTILKIGANAALQGSGLHCPICRVLGGMH